MPFQSEKQRRYLWANEPEIARDWTDTYGSGIAKALGGRIKNIEGYDHMLAYITPGEAKSLEDMGGKKVMTPEGIPAYPPQGQSAQHGGKESSSTSSSGGEGGHGVGRHAPTRKNAPDRTSQTNVPDGRTRIQNERQEDFRQKQMADLLNKQQAEKDYNPFGKMKPGPQLGLIGGGAGANIGNWASGFAGSKIGGGLGSMAFGPLGMILGSLFGRGIGQRAYQASQTEEKEGLRDILFGENTLLSNLFNKQKTPNTMGGEGLEGIDLSKMVDKFNPQEDDFDITEERFAFKPNSRKDKRIKTLHNQKTEGLFWNEQNQKEYEQLLKEDAEQTDYPKSVII